jgi:hypothetical protein
VSTWPPTLPLSMLGVRSLDRRGSCAGAGSVGCRVLPQDVDQSVHGVLHLVQGLRDAGAPEAVAGAVEADGRHHDAGRVPHRSRQREEFFLEFVVDVREPLIPDLLEFLEQDGPVGDGVRGVGTRTSRTAS